MKHLKALAVGAPIFCVFFALVCWLAVTVGALFGLSAQAVGTYGVTGLIALTAMWVVGEYVLLLWELRK